MAIRVLDPWWSPNRNAGGNSRSGITVHHAAGTSFEAIGSTFQDTSRQTSAHWGVGPGYAQQYVAEGDTAWHTGNARGNRETVGIECLNSGGEGAGWPVAEETVDALCELAAAIAARNGMGELEAGRNLFGHRDWSATACPGVLYARLAEIAERANAINRGENEEYGNNDDSEETMQCIIQPNGQNKLCYFDGQKIHYLAHMDQVTALNMTYRACHGRDIPCFALGTPEAPYAGRLLQALNNDDPNFASF